MTIWTVLAVRKINLINKANKKFKRSCASYFLEEKKHNLIDMTPPLLPYIL